MARNVMDIIAKYQDRLLHIRKGCGHYRCLHIMVYFSDIYRYTRVVRKARKCGMLRAWCSVCFVTVDCKRNGRICDLYLTGCILALTAGLHKM